MRRYVPLAIAVVVAVVCVRLGLWQLSRLNDRREVNATRATRLAQPQLQITEWLALDSTGAGRRAEAAGVFDFTRELIVVARSFRGVPGVHIVTPLRLPDGSALLVERGWVPSADGRSIDLERVRERAWANPTGLLLGNVTEQPEAIVGDAVWPRYVRRVTPPDHGAAYPYPVLDLLLRRTELPDSAPQEMRAVPLPELSDGPHLSYAIQWFAFAVIAVIGSVALVVKGSREFR